MTVISESIFNQQEFYKNSKKNRGRNVIWKGENLNTPHTNELLVELTENNMSITDFLSIIKRDTSDMNNTKFLFSITTVARYNLNFVNFCKIIGIFSSIDLKYKKSYQSARMFKNMLLNKKAGENFPIMIPEDLKAKLKIFNKFSNLPILALLDVLDISSNDLLRKRMNPKQYESIVYLLLKTSKKIFKKSAHQLFEKEICKKTMYAYKDSGYKRYARQFRMMLRL